MPLRPRRATVTLLLLTMLGMAVTGPALSASAAPAVALSNTSVAAAADFATRTYADSWDFENSADLPLSAGRAGNGVSNPFLQDGVYYADVASGGWLNLVQTISGSYAYGRDGQAMPIDTAAYTRFSVRMYSDKADVAKVWWNNCPQMALSCYGAAMFTTHAGWGVYDIALQKRPDTSAAWSGPMVGIRLDPISNRGGRIALDWVRLYQPASTGQVTVSGPANADILLDQDTNPSNGNETVVRRDDATLRTGANGAAVLDSSLLAPGTWQVAARTSGGVSYAPTALTVNPPPMPVVLDPDVSGGADVNDVMGNSRWDMSESSDVSSHPNVTGSVANGVFNGRNAGPTINDPVVSFTMPGLIDGTRFHRLTVKASYDGPFSLADAPGGGMMARWVWAVAGVEGLHSGEDLVVTTGDQTITMDLNDDPAKVIDPGSQLHVGWTGQRISYVRFDPNEDPSTARTWRIDDVKLAEDDKGAGSFDVRYQDANWAPGTTADIAVRKGSTGGPETTLARAVPVTQGVNSFRWTLGSLPAGTYWVAVTMTRGGAGTATGVSTGPVQMTGGLPYGSLDQAVAAGKDGIRMQGWAVDPASGDTPSPVHMYVDGRGLAGTTGGARADVAQSFGVSGNHGFDLTMSGVSAGAHQVCAYAFRPSGSPLLGCRTVTLAAAAADSATIGSLDTASIVTGGTRVTGWALDRGTPASIGLHVYVDGAFSRTATADTGRADVAAAFPGYGDRHGFAVDVAVPAGNHTVCVFAIDQVPPGSNALLGCRAVNQPASPWGSVDALTRYGNTLTARGWVVDPRRSTGTAAHVYVDGVGAANIATTTARADVNATFPAYAAPTPGFGATVQVSNGPHTVCVFGVGAQTATLMVCKTL